MPPFGVPVARCSLSFAAGDPAAFPLDIPPSYRRKGLVALDGDSLFAELAIARLFVRSEWNAYWRDGYGQRCVADRDLSRRSVSLPRPSLGASVIDVVQAAHGSSLSGCWDVLAWTDERIAFVESKRRGGDRLQETQGRWLDAALAVGIPREAFVVLEWDFIHTNPTLRPPARRPDLSHSLLDQTNGPTPRTTSFDQAQRKHSHTMVAYVSRPAVGGRQIGRVASLLRSVWKTGPRARPVSSRGRRRAEPDWK